MHAHEHVVAVRDVAVHDGDVLLPVERADRYPWSANSPSLVGISTLTTAPPALRPAPVRDQVGDGEILSSWSAQYATRSGTRAIVPSSLRISQITPTGRRPASRAGRPLPRYDHCARARPRRARAQREDVAGPHEVDGPAAGVAGTADRLRAVRCRDAGVDALGRVDRNGERRSRSGVWFSTISAQAEPLDRRGRRARGTRGRDRG